MKKLDQFLTEKEEQKKATPKPISSESGADDEAYLKLMQEYKQKRRKDGKEANKIREKAEKLVDDGDVSDNAIMAAAYL
ncbi:hypothetical protein SCRM01_129c [Synechococcus phage S-CRM01]|uniref:hypothetical protein n=1 Tax=Synechococcus phage S-CRM01 TaxID=1026955 RepID=UPI000209E3D2|nr:hypothetical protein SCRM01_129c [Synechococcus phage S-CRM01]AEC53075.1 hypothetical protein SCRM01_129c [Synechococcus phage S-CRM01]